MNNLRSRKFAAGMAAFIMTGLFAVSGFAQEAASKPDDQVQKMEKFVVTGSYLPESGLVTASPIVTLQSSELGKAGATDALQLLRELTPYFSGNGNVGTELNNGGTGESNVALRNLTTLVLINGQRLVTSPFSNTNGGTPNVDLNTIPTAMIERIEILKDGASTIYGTDAIGGVVNVILKQNYNGFEVGARYSSTGNGDYKARSVYIIGGVSQPGLSITIGAQHFENTPLLTTDRSLTTMAPSQITALGYNVTSSVFSGTYPGRVNSDILAGSPLAVGAAKYNASIVTPPAKTNPNAAPQTLAQLEAAGIYIPVSSTPAYASVGSTSILNTTLFGNPLIVNTKRNEFMANADKELIGKNLEVFGDFLFSQTTNGGSGLAPAPVTGVGSGGGNTLTDEYGGSSSNPLPGMDASDYGEGFARGGGIATARHGYADGGAPDDPFGDANRQLAYDLLRSGQGIQSPDSLHPSGRGTQSPTMMPGGESAPTQGIGSAVLNPDEPYRTDQSADDSWRAGNPVPPLGTSPAPQNDDGDTLPSLVTAGASVPSRGVAPASTDETALGYADAPSAGVAPPATTNPNGAYWAPISHPTASSSGSGLPNLGIANFSPNARSGLLAAGLGMLASRSPNLGNAIGEGGLAGLSAYSAAQLHDEKVAQEAAKLSKEAQTHAEEMKLKTDTLGENIRHNTATEATANDKSKFAPIGSVMSGGESHPLVMDQNSGKILDAATGKPPQIGDKIVTKDQGGKNDPAIAEHISHAIQKGERSKLDESGFDLSKAQIEWKRAEKQVATLNGPQMTRFVGLAGSVNSTIDEVRELSKQMNNSGIPKLNAAKLALYMQGE